MVPAVVEEAAVVSGRIWRKTKLGLAIADENEGIARRPRTARVRDDMMARSIDCRDAMGGEQQWGIIEDAEDGRCG